MNDLYLIGNGFDLAHGLKTSYNHFLLWYLNNFLQQYRNRSYPEKFEDDLLKIIKYNTRYEIPNFDKISDLLKWLTEFGYNIKAKHVFFQKLIENYRDFKWVDIEYEYYMVLVEIYKGLENKNLLRSDFHFGQVIPLNLCFDSIKKKLGEYLLNLEISSKQENRKIESILLEGTGSEGNEKGDKLFVYFNYTRTIELYTRKYFVKQNNWIYIHGILNDPSNPIIFGYGDEMDPHYEKIENLNNNEFLKNIKSFSYFKTDNYQKVIRFLDNDFTVKILGHSCGLSDRILLNTIFEHPNCKAIKIYYYQKSETEDDYFEKTQEISRHFKSSAKGEMRKKIVPFNSCSPLIPFKK